MEKFDGVEMPCDKCYKEQGRYTKDEYAFALKKILTHIANKCPDLVLLCSDDLSKKYDEGYKDGYKRAREIHDPAYKTNE